MAKSSESKGERATKNSAGGAGSNGYREQLGGYREVDGGEMTHGVKRDSRSSSSKRYIYFDSNDKEVSKRNYTNIWYIN